MKIKIFEKLKSSDMFINVTRISSGTILGQIISLITIPIFSRLYGSEIIGVWAFFNTMAILINSFSDLGLTNSIMMEKDDNKILQSYKVVSLIVGIISILSGVIYYIYSYFMKSNQYNMSSIFLALYVSLAIYTLQQTQICYTWLNRKKEYKVLMKNPIINNLSFGIVACFLGVIGVKNYGYFVGWLIGQILTLIHMKRYLPKKNFNVEISEFKEVFKRNKKFCLFQLPTNIITQVKNQLPTILIKYLFGTNILGQYSITIRVINVPINLLGTAIGRVFFQKSSEIQRDNKPVGDFTYRNITRAMRLAIMPVIILMAFGDIIFNIILGPGWELAGNIIRILALQAFFMFLIMSTQGISIIINKQNYAMIAGICQIIGIAISLIIGKIIFNNLYIGLIFLSVTFILVNVIYFCFLFKAMNISWKKYLINISLNIGIVIIGYIIIRVFLYFIGFVNSL